MPDNIINKLVFEADLSTSLPSNYALKQSERYYLDYVLPAIERVIDKYEDQRVRIDDAEEIDLGRVQPHEIAERLEMLLDELLQKYMASGQLKPVSKHYLPSDFSPKDILPGESALPTPDTGLDYVECFFHYLMEPVVPWYIREREGFDIEVIAGKALKKTEESLSLQKRLLEIISKDKDTYTRFTFFLPATAPVLEKLVGLKLSPFVVPQGIAKIYERILRQATVKSTVKTRKNLYTNILGKLLFEDFEKMIIAIGDDSDNVNKDSIETRRQVAGKTQPGNTSPEHHTIQPHLFANSSDNTISPEVPDNKEAIRRIPIGNGGLVILHPFLCSLFRSLGLLDKNNGFKSVKKQVRAAHLLQYATGAKTKHFDHLLPFCKVLCGLNPFFPIHPAFRVTRDEKDEITDLLNAVIRHWPVLKNTSVEGLQKTFIRRDALLEKSGKDWIVRIENRGVDVLLDDLPWDIHLAALPWNKYMVFAEWKHH